MQYILVVKSFLLKAFAFFLISTVGAVVVLKFVPIWITPLMVVRKIESASERKSTELYHDWTSYEDISKEMALAVVSSEDQLFPAHYGFDFKSMYNAFRYNWRGRKIRGASTISQQVAKNVFLWHGRSYVRKVAEVYFTFLIELIWGKERILEVYLNVAETGPMTFGVEAAAQRYYQKNAANLSHAEAARMAAVLPNPRRFLVANPSAYVQARTNKIARQMRMLGKNYISAL